MKKVYRAIIISVILALQAIPAASQKQLYTRSYRIQDFRSATVKVVLSGSAELNAALREEVTSMWVISPYEFCSVQEYEKDKNNPALYFLQPRAEKGIVYLTLTKGGVKGSPDAMKTPMKLAEIPVAGEHYNAPLLYMPAYVSILQDYMEKALRSEWVAYFGLSSSSSARHVGTKVYKDPSDAEKVFRSRDEGAAVMVVITPDGKSKSRPRYTLVFDAGSLVLYSISKG